MIWFTGCTHFGHANIIRLANRPFRDVAEMDEALIDGWNSRVHKTDVVYHLGDFAWGEAAMPALNRLNGIIHLIRGNHDPDGWGPDYRELRYARMRFVMCHYPFREWNGFYRGAIHLHCHTHSHTLHTTEEGNDGVIGHRFNVGVEACGYLPISVDEIIDRSSTWRHS